MHVLIDYSLIELPKLSPQYATLKVTLVYRLLDLERRSVVIAAAQFQPWSDLKGITIFVSKSGSLLLHWSQLQVESQDRTKDTLTDMFLHSVTLPVYIMISASTTWSSLLSHASDSMGYHCQWHFKAFQGLLVPGPFLKSSPIFKMNIKVKKDPTMKDP